MAESPQFGSQFADPRVIPQFCRHWRDERGSVTLLGVVHDHPSSIARVETVLDAVEPDVLALELPDIAIPLYRTYANQSGSAGQRGGEMCAAIRTVPDARVVGIDAPNWAFIRQLTSRFVTGRLSPTAAGEVASSVAGVTRDAVACRIGATLVRSTPLTVVVDDPLSYDCESTDSPKAQAAHERAHVAGIRSLIQLSDTESNAVACRDDIRERCMAEQIETLRDSGSIAAVVGVDHLDSLESQLRS